jgi:hypothetical protein
MVERKYSIKNPVMFAIIMKKPEFCIGLLERIFPGRKVKDLRFVYAANEAYCRRLMNELNIK